MNLNKQELGVLVAVRQHKKDSSDPETWPSAADIAPRLGQPEAEIAAVMRDLASSNYLVRAPGEARMYGSPPKTPSNVKYGLSTEGGRLARYFSSNVGQRDLLKREILALFRQQTIETPRRGLTPRGLAAELEQEAQQVRYALNDLVAARYLDQFHEEADGYDTLFILTERGYAMADQIERGGNWDAPAPTTTQIGTQINNRDTQIGAIQTGEYAVAHIQQGSELNSLITALEGLRQQLSELKLPNEVRDEAAVLIDMVFEEAQNSAPRPARMQTSLKSLHRLLEANPGTVAAVGTVAQILATFASASL